MPDKKTVYVIGAGASSEALLPTGVQLKDRIANLLNIGFMDGMSQSSGDKYISEALKIYARQPDVLDKNFNSYLHAAWHIRDAMPLAISIDNFIDTHNDDKKIELCGKLAIVRSILEAERNSSLYFDDSNSYNKLNFSLIENTWYTSFFMLLTENCVKANLEKRLKSIALIVFNYDRCIEHFLYNALQNYYGLEPIEAGDLVKGIEIYHPYGIVGSLPWQDIQENQAVKYGANPNPKKLLHFSSQIKTFTEGTDPKSSQILSIRNNMFKADKIVFLGFAFHDLNMEIIMPDSSRVDPYKRLLILGTAYGISESNCKMIISKIFGLFRRTSMDINDIHINSQLNCSGLFKEYWRNLSLS
jgi:hypothetical protein